MQGIGVLKLTKTPTQEETSFLARPAPVFKQTSANQTARLLVKDRTSMLNAAGIDAAKT